MNITLETTIRKADHYEAEALTALALRSKAYWGYSQEFMAACRAELTYSQANICNNHFFVAENGNSIVGFYGLVRLSTAEIELEAMFVEPAFIGQGLGRTLIEHAKKSAANLGAVNMIVQSDPHATSFYLAAGGTLTGQTTSGSISGRYLPTFTIQL